jgi:hypothetical protein
MKAPAPFAQVMKRLRNARQPNGRRPTGACGLVPSQQRWDGWPVQVDTHWQSNETNEIIMTSTLLSCTYVRLYEQSNALSKAMATAMPDEQWYQTSQWRRQENQNKLTVRHQGRAAQGQGVKDSGRVGDLCECQPNHESQVVRNYTFVGLGSPLPWSSLLSRLSSWSCGAQHSHPIFTSKHFSPL